MGVPQMAYGVLRIGLSSTLSSLSSTSSVFTYRGSRRGALLLVVASRPLSGALPLLGTLRAVDLRAALALCPLVYK